MKHKKIKAKIEKRIKRKIKRNLWQKWLLFLGTPIDKPKEKDIEKGLFVICPYCNNNLAFWKEYKIWICINQNCSANKSEVDFI